MQTALAHMARSTEPPLAGLGFAGLRYISHLSPTYSIERTFFSFFDFFSFLCFFRLGSLSETSDHAHPTPNVSVSAQQVGPALYGNTDWWLHATATGVLS